MRIRRLVLFALVSAALGLAQERQLPLEDVLRRKAGQFRLSSAWVGGSVFDLSAPIDLNTSTPPIRAYSQSAGMAVDWTYLGSRTTAYGNYAGDYSLSKQAALDALSQSANVGMLRRVTPRFSMGFAGQYLGLNLGSRLFQQPQAARDLQSAGFGSTSGGTLPGLGGTLDPIGEANRGLAGIGSFGLLLGGNQRQYGLALMGGLLISPRTDFRVSVSANQGEYLDTTGLNVQLPYLRARGFYSLASIQHQATERTSVTWQVQGGQTRAQGEAFNFVASSFGLGRTIAPRWTASVSGGGGMSTVFRAGLTVPWVFQYTGMAQLGYASTRQAMMLSVAQDAGDQIGMGFQGTTQLNLFWNFRPPTSGWALSARAGGVLLRGQGIPNTRAATLQVGLSRRLFADVHALAEVAYVTNVLFAQQRLLAQAAGGGVLDTLAQRAARLSIVYRPSPDRK